MNWSIHLFRYMHHLLAHFLISYQMKTNRVQVFSQAFVGYFELQAQRVAFMLLQWVGFDKNDDVQVLEVYFRTSITVKLFLNIRQTLLKEIIQIWNLYFIILIGIHYQLLSQTKHQVAKQLNMTEQSIEDKLRNIQSQRRKLRDRINKIQETQKNKTQADDSAYNYQQTMAKLLDRKKKMEAQKIEKQRIKKLKEQYEDRKQYQQRLRKLQQIQNDKRILELQLAMKKAVFNGVKEKVKGMNSEQLMSRIMLRGQAGKSAPNISNEAALRRQFQNFIEISNKKPQDQKPTYDIQKLNEKRIQIFQAKQLAVMREILIKQFREKKQYEIDVFRLSRDECEDYMRQFGYEIEDYIHPISKEDIINQIQDIKMAAEQRIQKNKQQIAYNAIYQRQYSKHIAKIKQSLKEHNQSNVLMARQIVYKLIDQVVHDFQRRITSKSKQDNQNLYQTLQKQYNELILQNEENQFAQMIVNGLLQTIHSQMQQQAAEQVYALNLFAHLRTQQVLGWMFNDKNIQQQIKEADSLPIKLNFTDELTKPLNQDLKKNDYVKKFQEQKSNIFDVDQLTTELINDINLLEVEENYFESIIIKFEKETYIKQQPFKLLYDQQLYTVSNRAAYRTVKDNKCLNIKIADIHQLLSVKKFNKNWLIHDSGNITLYTPWNVEVLPNKIGDRISNKAGKPTVVQWHPVMTILGSPCSIMIGYEKGQIMKYNFNTDRITLQQTNLTYYEPIITPVKIGDEPPFPLQYRDLISVTNKKIQQGANIHQFRQFFDFHMSKIIAIVFYKFDTFLSIDQNMKCAIWHYSMRQGGSSYQPIYTCEFICSYKVYKQAENPRFKTIFPSPDIKESQSQLYKQWMQSESFLKKQLYNNPKKQTAYFKAPDFDYEKAAEEKPLWKITYDDSKRAINKIYQSFYQEILGTMQCKQAKIWRKFLFIMAQREHVIRGDLKSIKIYGWNIQTRKMRNIAVEFDMFKNQTSMNFEILDSLIVGIEIPIISVVSSGRILLFSMLSGQLLRNLSDQQYINDPKYSKYFFTSIISGPSYFAASTQKSVIEITVSDRNNNEKQKHYKQVLQIMKKKHLNFI